MMAVFVARYVSRGERERSIAQAYIGYIGHRAGRDKTPIHRQLWGEAGQLSYEQAVSMVAKAKPGSWFYRLSIDPSPANEDVHRDIHLKSLTATTLTQIQQQMDTDVPWIAAIHDDHTDKRHVHVLAVTPRRMNRVDLNAVRQAATDECRGQRLQLDAYRTLRQQLERDQVAAERDVDDEHQVRDQQRVRVRRAAGGDGQEEAWDEQS